MISVDEAFKIVIGHCTSATIESIAIDNSLGRVLAEEIRADRDFPPFDRVTMDGIAIKYQSVADGQNTYKIESVAAAGAPQKTLSNSAHCLEVMTGSILPNNCDTVVRYEDLEIADDHVTILNQKIEQRQNVHAQGSDRKINSTLLSSGKKIGPAEMAVLATCGKAIVKVYATPSIAIISSGDELVNVEQKPLPHQIRKSNTYSISAALRSYECKVDRFHLIDDQDAIENKLSEILKSYDVIVLSGGVSMGKFDYIPESLEKLSVKKLFHKVAQRPGKPFWFGVSDLNKTVFALPGNPVSSFMCTIKYVIPWLQKHLHLPTIKMYAILNSPIKFKPDLNYFAQVKLFYDNQGRILAEPIEGNGSGDLANLTDADAFMELPRGKDTFEKGEVFQVLTF